MEIRKICEECVDKKNLRSVLFVTAWSYEDCFFCKEETFVADFRNYKPKPITAKKKKTVVINGKGEEVVL